MKAKDIKAGGEYVIPRSLSQRDRDDVARVKVLNLSTAGTIRVWDGWRYRDKKIKGPLVEVISIAPAHGEENVTGAIFLRGRGGSNTKVGDAFVIEPRYIASTWNQHVARRMHDDMVRRRNEEIERLNMKLQDIVLESLRKRNITASRRLDGSIHLSRSASEDLVALIERLERESRS